MSATRTYVCIYKEYSFIIYIKSVVYKSLYLTKRALSGQDFSEASREGLYVFKSLKNLMLFSRDSIASYLEFSRFLQFHILSSRVLGTKFSRASHTGLCFLGPHTLSLNELLCSDSTILGSLIPDSAILESYTPNSATMVSLIPDSAILESYTPDSATMVSHIPDSAILVSHIPDSAILGSYIPDSAILGSYIPDSAIFLGPHIPDSAIPSSSSKASLSWSSCG